MTRERDIFKNSPKSICHQCFNINENCMMPMKVCETDKKLHIAYVTRCQAFNAPMKKEYEAKTVSVQTAADTRIEMMGGGHK